MSALSPRKFFTTRSAVPKLKRARWTVFPMSRVVMRAVREAGSQPPPASPSLLWIVPCSGARNGGTAGSRSSPRSSHGAATAIETGGSAKRSTRSTRERAEMASPPAREARSSIYPIVVRSFARRASRFAPSVQAQWNGCPFGMSRSVPVSRCSCFSRIFLAPGVSTCAFQRTRPFWFRRRPPVFGRVALRAIPGMPALPSAARNDSPALPRIPCRSGSSPPRPSRHLRPPPGNPGRATG